MIQWRTPSLYPICVVLASSKILSRLLCLPCSKFRSPVEHTKIPLLAAWGMPSVQSMHRWRWLMCLGMSDMTDIRPIWAQVASPTHSLRLSLVTHRHPDSSYLYSTQTHTAARWKVSRTRQSLLDASERLWRSWWSQKTISFKSLPCSLQNLNIVNFYFSLLEVSC